MQLCNHYHDPVSSLCTFLKVDFKSCTVARNVFSFCHSHFNFCLCFFLGGDGGGVKTMTSFAYNAVCQQPCPAQFNTVLLDLPGIPLMIAFIWHMVFSP